MKEKKSGLKYETERSILDVLHRYFWLVDVGRANEVASLFAPNATLTFGPGTLSPGTLAGDEIDQSLETRAKQTDLVTRHVLSNVRFTQNADDSVSSYGILTLYRSNGKTPVMPALIADVEDKLVHHNREWLIKTRLFSPVFH